MSIQDIRRIFKEEKLMWPNVQVIFRRLARCVFTGIKLGYC